MQLEFLKTALSNPNDVSLEELMKVEEVIHYLKIQKIQEATPILTGIGFF